MKHASTGGWCRRSSHENSTCIRHVLATQNMWPPGLSKGQHSLFLKLHYISRFEHAAKSNEGMIVILNERDIIGGLA